MNVESLQPVALAATMPWRFGAESDQTPRLPLERKPDPVPAAAAIELIEVTGGSSGTLMLGKHIDTYA